MRGLDQTSPGNEMKAQPENEDEIITTVVVRLNAVTTGLALGALFGTGLFLATIFLVLKGGANPGPHLSLLGQYLPGYAVTFGGSVVGFLYAFLIGFLSGFALGSVYNRIAR
jgi:hypothetical protein